MIEKPTEIKALTAGAANQVLWLKGRTESYIFKWLRHNQQFGLDRCEEFDLQQQLATEGLAPEVIALDPKQWVLQRYVAGTPLTSSALTSAERLEVTAKTLVMIHQQQPSWNGTTIWDKSEFYADRLGQAEKSQLARFKEELSSSHPNVLCHFDLAFAHILLNQRVMVVDWEYAGWGDRLTDIASTIEINQLDEPSAESLCKHYQRHSGHIIERQDLAKHRLFVRWLNQQWEKLLKQ